MTTGKELYPHLPKLANRKFFACKPCDAYVGTHEHTGMSLGRLANKKLRQLKSEAHRMFDPIWQNPTTKYSRKGAYAWLAGALEIQPKWCHIGMFNEKQCLKVIDLARTKRKELSPFRKMLSK